MIRFGSVCSGIEAASVATQPLGWGAEFFAEIDPFASAVLAHHYPDVPNHGDMTRFQEWPDAAINVLVGGTPCQSFSVAGLRKGLDDPRGNLSLTYLAIADRYRPDWLVWENVPGVLSSGGGRDFGAFLGALGKLGYGFAYRVLDAQYFGLAQRRKRVFVVGYLGDWRRAAAVLFERESLQGHTAPSREAREAVAPTVRAGAPNGGAGHGARSGDSKDELIVPVVSGAMQATYGKGYGTGEVAGDLVAQGVALRGREGGATAELTGAVQPALRCGGGGGDKPHAIVPPVSPALKARDGKGPSSDGDGDGAPLVVEASAFDARQSDVIQYGDKTGSLDTCGSSIGVQLSSMVVRRLTPTECARLQGFPDDYLSITYRGKPAADGPKYKALGNSWAVPCVQWIFRRITLMQELADEGAI